MTPTTHPTADAVHVLRDLYSWMSRAHFQYRTDEGRAAEFAAKLKGIITDSERAAIQPSGEPTGQAEAELPLTRSVYGSKEALDAEIARRDAAQPVQPAAALTADEAGKVETAKRGMVDSLIASGMNYGSCGVVSYHLNQMIAMLAAAPAAPASAPVEAAICAGPCKNDPGNPCPGCPYGKNWDGDDESVEAVSVRADATNEGSRALMDTWNAGAAMQLALAALDVATTPLPEDRQTVLRAQAALRRALQGKPEAPKGGE